MNSKFLLPLMGLLLAIKLSINIYRIWRTGDRITQAQVQLDNVKKEQAELKQRLAQVQTAEFVEKEAREKLGYGKDGEIIVIVPKLEESQESDSSEGPIENWRKWWELYIGI
jgi:cell division protein FtsB